MSKGIISSLIKYRMSIEVHRQMKPWKEAKSRYAFQCSQNWFPLTVRG